MNTVRIVLSRIIPDYKNQEVAKEGKFEVVKQYPQQKQLNLLKHFKQFKQLEKSNSFERFEESYQFRHFKRSGKYKYCVRLTKVNRPKGRDTKPLV